MITKKWSDDKDQYVNICNIHKSKRTQADILKKLSKPASSIEKTFKSKLWDLFCFLCIIIAIVWFLKGIMS